jgi:hypothetical protein
MATPYSSPSTPRFALQCGAAGQLTAPAPLGWRERLLQTLNLIRWSRASSAVRPVPFGYEVLGGLDEHLLADIGAPESVRERARYCQQLQRQRVLELEHGHRSIGEGRW